MRKILAGPPKQIVTPDNIVPIVYAYVQPGNNGPLKVVRVLLDSGATGCLIDAELAKGMPMRHFPKPDIWSTGGGLVKIDRAAEVTFTIPELYRERTIKYDFKIQPVSTEYAMIVGQDLLAELGIIIDFDTLTVTWAEATIPFKPSSAKMHNINEHFHIEESSATKEMTERAERIVAAKYEKIDVDEFVKSCRHLSTREKIALNSLLRKFEKLFDGTLGYWLNEEYDIELKPGAKPYHARAYGIPKAYEDITKVEVQRLCEIGVIRKVNRSMWAAPTFVIPKKDGTVRFISDFRELNKWIKRKPFPIPLIQDLLLKLEGFQYATSLDLNMGYYHISLSTRSRELCTIVLPWGKYEYQRLPMGLANSPDIFQEKMSELMDGLEYVRTYLDDLLILTKGTFEEHLENVTEVLKRLQKAGLKVNVKKSFFAQSELEYLGYWITRDGIQPVKKKVDAILNIAPPKNRKELRSFIGLVNYYRDMWAHRSHVLAPLTSLTSSETKWEWTENQQLAFDKVKAIVGRQVMLAFPDFSLPFHINTDASHHQLGAVISQNGKPIAFYSRKLSPAQSRYTTTERELLSIVETLKEFRNILLGQKIIVYTDHKNLTYATYNTERVMRWRLLIEEFNPELTYMPGHENVVADALSRLDMVDKVQPPLSNYKYTRLYNGHYFGMKETEVQQDMDIFPLTFERLRIEQQRDIAVQKLLKSTKISCAMQSFRGGGKTFNLVVHQNKIVVPKSLQLRAVQWYHLYLVHAGETRTEQTIRQYFWWPKLRDEVHNVCTKCQICQTTKKSTKKYGHLPPKVAESVPWEILCIDLIGPYTITRKKPKKPFLLWAMTMIDPATGWFEMRQIQTKSADRIANLLEEVWLSRYPWPTQIVFDRGSEFKAEVYKMITEAYGIKARMTTARNPQANAVVERVHQTIGNMIRTFRMYERNDLDEDDPWTGILSAIMAAVRSTYSTTTRATPSQLVFGRDAILNVKFTADWDKIRQRKQALIELNNIRENAKRKAHTYEVGNKVLVKNDNHQKFGGPEYSGPYVILAVNDNGTVRLQRRYFAEPVNIRNIKPYKE
jgi:RNase H-like domain found in reverse transcriptase/Reverse transcriptase (RNA-dependent DNA polymerase)/Integrase zinc binding domain